MKLEEYVYVDSRIASVENPLSQIAISLVNYLTYGNYVDTTGVAIPHKSPITGYKSNKNMKKTSTESQMRQIVKESIRKVLRGSNDFDEFENEEFVDKDGQPIQKGSNVIWFDPERSARDLKRMWTVYDMGGDIVYIADDYGEAEVFPQELKVVC